VSIDPNCGEVVLTSNAERAVAIDADREGLAYDDIGPAEKTVRKALQKQLQSDLHGKPSTSKTAAKRGERKARRPSRRLAKGTEQAINRVTAER